MSREQEVKTHQPRRRGPMGHGMQPGEKPKDLKKSIKKLMSYIGKYKVAIFVVMFFAACSTIFNVAGPKILGKATTALSEGLMAKIQPEALILERLEAFFCLCLVCICAVRFSTLSRDGS